MLVSRRKLIPPHKLSRWPPAGSALSGLARAQIVEELDAFAQAPLGHVPAARHLERYLGDLARSKIEGPVEVGHRLLHLDGGEVRIADRAVLNAAVAQQVAAR